MSVNSLKLNSYIIKMYSLIISFFHFVPISLFLFFKHSIILLVSSNFIFSFFHIYYHIYILLFFNLLLMITNMSFQLNSFFFILKYIFCKLSKCIIFENITNLRKILKFLTTNFLQCLKIKISFIKKYIILFLKNITLF